jgi:hypothetical protein
MSVARRKDGSGESATIIPFVRPRAFESSASAGFYDRLLSDRGASSQQKLPDGLKELIESKITEVYIRLMTSFVHVPDGPFDPIYLSRLTVDLISEGDVARLKKFFDIRDLSEAIDFDDEWSA